jgi:excisionase family DNA binding protein
MFLDGLVSTDQRKDGPLDRLGRVKTETVDSTALMETVLKRLEALDDQVARIRRELAPRGLYGQDEAAAYLGISRSEIERLIARGELPSVPVGRRRLVPHAALDAFIEAHTTNGHVLVRPRRGRPRKRPG